MIDCNCDECRTERSLQQALAEEEANVIDIAEVWGESRPRVGKRAASATPPAFRDVLLEMARSAKPEKRTA